MNSQSFKRFTSKRLLLIIISLAIVSPKSFSGILIQTQDTLKLLSPQDYGQWENIGYGGTISNNGNWLVYPIQRNNDQGELRLHDLSKNTVEIIENGVGAQFSNQNAWLGYLINPSPAERKKLDKAKKPVYHNFGLVNLEYADTLQIEKI